MSSLASTAEEGLVRHGYVVYGVADYAGQRREDDERVDPGGHLVEEEEVVVGLGVVAELLGEKVGEPVPGEDGHDGEHPESNEPDAVRHAGHGERDEEEQKAEAERRRKEVGQLLFAGRVQQAEDLHADPGPEREAGQRAHRLHVEPLVDEVDEEAVGRRARRRAAAINRHRLRQSVCTIYYLQTQCLSNLLFTDKVSEQFTIYRHNSQTDCLNPEPRIFLVFLGYVRLYNSMYCPRTIQSLAQNDNYERKKKEFSLLYRIVLYRGSERKRWAIFAG